MANPLTCKAILFDMDGVLVDSTAVVERSWRKWAKANAIDEEKLMPLIHGRKALETISISAPHLDAEMEWQILIKQEMDDAPNLKPYAGAKTLLEGLTPNAWAVVTSAPKIIALDRLKFADLPIPDVFICAEDIVNGKPAPDGFLAAAEQLGVKPDDCIVLEDAPSGVDAALAGGMQALAIASTYDKTHLTHAHECVANIADITVDSLDGMLRLYVNSIRS